MSPRLHRMLGKRIEYTRQAGFDRLQHEQLVKNYIAQEGKVTRGEVADLCQLTPDQAYKLLRRLVEAGVIEKQGDRKNASYVLR